MMVNFQTLSEMGLLWKINKEILHPLGLALCRDRHGNISPGALVAEDGAWMYTPESDIKNSAKFNTVLSMQKEGTLLDYLKREASK